MPNLVFVRSAAACPRISEFVTHGVYFFLPFFHYNDLHNCAGYNSSNTDAIQTTGGRSYYIRPITT